MEASRSPSAPATDLAAYTRDPFGGFFDGRDPGELVPPGTLLDTPEVHRWFDLMRRGLPESLYTYQLPLARAARPESGALGRDLLMFSSYSYLGLIGDPRLAEEVGEAVARYGTSTGGVRLLTGTLDLHHRLEAELADFIGAEAAAVFSSGYDANVAAITSLFGPGDWAILDQYAHRSIQDGCRMAGVDIRPFRHNNLEDLERRLKQAGHRRKQRVLVAVDGVFSMDGDQAPLAEIIRLKERYGASLRLDEAHALGAIGATGRRLTVTGTGLTHLGSAEGRDAMHKAAATGQATDSMRMFRMGLEGGKPAALPPAPRARCSYFASGSGRSWKCRTLLVVPSPVSIWKGARVLMVAQIPRPFQPASGSSMRPSIHFV